MARNVIAVGLGGAIAYLGLTTMALNDLLHALVFATAGAFVAGWIAERRGPVIGIAAMLAAAVFWSADVLIRTWSSGQLGLQYPDCDPCGLSGTLGRMVIVTAIFAPYFAPVGLLGGWLGSVARGRLRPGKRGQADEIHHEEREETRVDERKSR